MMINKNVNLVASDVHVTDGAAKAISNMIDQKPSSLA
jgi:hypothetical protein